RMRALACRSTWTTLHPGFNPLFHSPVSAYKKAIFLNKASFSPLYSKKKSLFSIRRFIGRERIPGL
ncbi:MAG: hypothetical protein Q3991_08190, partial [Rothia sp. (in: high G+C Gram-positive bacteria)]|uniref:hypothetical protein n=1 Tax=Rothia sp. (in: high G+C Gram-positive bacteria) TaxID=1885016 RepID=UPI0026DD5679